MLPVNFILEEEGRCFEIFVTRVGHCGCQRSNWWCRWDHRSQVRGYKVMAHKPDGAHTYLLWSAEYSKRCSNISPTLEQDFQKTYAFLTSFGNSHSLAIQGPKWSWCPHSLWRGISSLNWCGPNPASLTHGSFCLVSGGSYSVTLRHRVTCWDCASGHPSFLFCIM